MRRYITRQLVQLVVVIIGISILAFVILHVLGDPVLLLLPQNAGHAEFERYRKLLGLDQPIWLQYWKFASHAIQGDFGRAWYADTPAFCLGAALAPITMRLVRSGVIEVMNMEYIKTARAKGVGERTVVVKHAFRNACIPIITVLGLQFGQLLGGAIITETVFAWPGVATLTVESIRNQDFPVVQCAVVLLALIIVAANVIVDLVVGFIDPRIRVSS